MSKFIFDTNCNEGGDHTVHSCDCSCCPTEENCCEIGECVDCHDALAKAKKLTGKENFCLCPSCCEK